MSEAKEINEIKRFIVIDEDPENTTFFKVLLMEHQIPSVTMAQSSLEALDLLEPKRVQFCIVAREMNDMPGPIFIQKVRAQRQFRHLPCLIYSKDMQEHEVRLCKELGINVFAKPFNKEEIWTIVERMKKEEESLAPIQIQLREVEKSIGNKQFNVALNAMKGIVNNPEAAPHSAQINTLLGEVYLGLTDFEKSEHALDQALADKQNHTPAMQLIAKVYTKTDRHDKAVDMLVQMVDASPNNISTLLNLGNTYNDSDQLDKAKTTFNKVKELDPGNQEANMGLGQVAFKEGNMELAEQFLTEVENAEELARFFNNLAIGLVNKGKHQEGIRTYDASLKIMRKKDEKKVPLLVYNMGLAYKKKGEYLTAFTILSQCYLENPSFAKPYESLVRLVREMDRQDIEYDKSITDEIQKIRQAS